MAETCRLCCSEQTYLMHTAGKRSRYREFLRCRVCDLVFVPEEMLLTEAEERERYLQHSNDPGDEGYRRFLANLLDETAPLVKPGADALDYGCGPGPALVAMLREAGLNARGYDPHFLPEAEALTRTYDLVTCSETAEHFRQPAKEFATLSRLLKPRGWLGVMTGMLDDWSDFPSWHYHTDATHIGFYSYACFGWIARRHGWACHFPRRDVALLHRSDGKHSIRTR